MATPPVDRRPLYQHRQTGWPIVASALVPFVAVAGWSAFLSFGRTPPANLDAPLNAPLNASLNASLPAFLAEWSWLIPTDDRSWGPHLLPLLGGFALLVLGFSWLTVVVTSTHLVFRFGIGLFHRSIPLARIRRARVARSRWYEGWGIRWTRAGMLYNVSGFDAVAIDLDDGRSLRIGSDDADRLRGAIERAIERAVADARGRR